MEVDYTEITPWELFIGLLYKIHPQNQTYILFGDLDFTKFEVKVDEENKSIYLEQFINDERVVIDEYTYGIIIDYLCKADISRSSQIESLMVGTKELLGDKIDQKYTKYIRLNGIPSDEIDEFNSVYDAYRGLHGNHNREKKYEYVMNNLQILPVETLYNSDKK